MSLSAAVIDALVASGVSTEQLAAAMKAEIADQEAKIAERREKDAIRQRKSRSSRASRDVTVTPSDTADTVPPNDIYSNPPPEPVLPNGNTSPCRFSVEDAVEAWNETASRCSLPKAKTADGARAKNIRARLKAAGEEGWREALAAVERSKFCRGENDRGFRADIDFACQPKSFNRLREGFYGSDADVPGKVVQIDPIKFAESLDNRAALYRKIGREDDAIDAERQAARIRGPTPIGSLVRNIQTGVGQ